MAFFIEKIVASGAGKKESTIVFKPGANIIYGPSNTGKTYIVSFIVDGTANMPQISETQCPFCDGKIRIEKTPNYIEAAKSDYKKIKLQAKDLQKAYDELLAEKDILESSMKFQKLIIPMSTLFISPKMRTQEDMVFS